MSTMLAEYNQAQDAKAEAVLISVTPETIEDAKKYLTLTCKGASDKLAFEAVSKALHQCRGYKSAIEETRVAQKEPHLKRGREIDSAAKKLQEELAPVLLHLTQQENAVKTEMKRIEDAAKEAAHVARMDRLKAAGLEMSDAVVRQLTGIQFEQEIQRLTEAKRVADQAAARFAEQQAELEKLKAAQVEAERVAAIQRKEEADRQAEERKRIADERAALEAQRKEQIAAQQAITEREAAERIRLAREEAAKEATERSARETEARIHQEEVDRIAKAALADARKSDVEKVRQIAADIQTIRIPEVTDHEAAQLVDQFRGCVAWVVDNCGKFGR